MPLPELEPGDMPDIRTLSHADLEKTPHDVYRWECCVAGCTRHTKVKDFGTLPWVYWRREWVNLSQMVFYCVAHWKQYNKPEFQPPGGQSKGGPGLNHIHKIKSCY